MNDQEQTDFYMDSLNVHGYIESREAGQSHNELVEEPSFLHLLEAVDLAGRACLDLGCGYGHYSRILAERGASVIAIDRSALMIQAARERNPHARIRYQQMDMGDAIFADESFNLVISNLAFHYLSDIASLLKNISRWTRHGGHLIFTVEHPILTANRSMLPWCDGERGSQWIVSNYFESGERLGPFGLRYHRTFQEYFTCLVAAGFQISNIVEPQPSQISLRINPHLSQALHRPVFLGFKCCRPLPGQERL
jgi:2-polyprenyl-3-methyl-5-hydroxy-6-metoxy-1,4-benzoquinol methylase